MRRAIAVAVGLVCFAGTACAKGVDATLASSSSPSASSTAVSATPSVTPSAVPSPVDVPKDCPKPNVDLEISAINDSWIGSDGKPAEPGEICLAAPADEAFTVTLHNDVHNDVHNEGVFHPNHTFSVYADASGTDELFYGDLVYAGESFTYDVPALAAGAYVFKCDIHPQNMTGVLVVA
jgi:hypothetical protein